MEPEWLLDESQSLTGQEALDAASRSYGFERASEPAVNIVLSDVTIHNTHRWFGGAEVRLDALVVTPAPAEDQLYQANTFSFSGIRDGQDIPIDNAAGLGLYTGWPQYFLDFALVASRGGDDQQSLGDLVADSADSLSSLLGGVAQLTVAAPQVAAITGAAAAAAKLSGAVLRLLAKETGRSIGLYRATWYEHRDNFGIGDHPPDGDRFKAQDLSFRYQVFQDQPRP